MNPQDAWTAAYNQLEMQLDRASFNTWLRDAAFLRCEQDTFIVGVRNGYARDMLQHRLYRSVCRAVSDIYGQSVDLRFEIQKDAADSQSEAVPAGDTEMPLLRLLANQPAAETFPPLHEQVARPQRPELPESELNPRYTFDRFIVGSENPMLYPAARAVVDQPGTAYNPFLVYGGVGLGKTHLLQAIAHAFREKGLRAVYISSEAFTNDMVEAIRHRTTAMFRERYRSADVLVVDDVQFIAGKDSTQDEFFHTFNALHMFNKQIVLASDRHPSQLDGMVDRLRSRFQSGLVVDVKMPEFETRVAILRMWASERTVELPLTVAEMLANRARTNLRELESIFNQVVASSQLARQPLNCAMAEDVLDGYRRPRHHVSVAAVLDLTARYHGLSIDDLTGKSRSGPINQARQIAMYLARETTGASLPQIGDAFGGRKHSTVLHSCNKIADELSVDTKVQAAVQALREKLARGSH